MCIVWQVRRLDGVHGERGGRPEAQAAAHALPAHVPPTRHAAAAPRQQGRLTARRPARRPADLPACRPARRPASRLARLLARRPRPSADLTRLIIVVLKYKVDVSFNGLPVAAL